MDDQLMIRGEAAPAGLVGPQLEPLPPPGVGGVKEETSVVK